MPEVSLNQNPQTTQPPQKPKRNWKKILLILLVVLILISLVGIGLYLLIPRLTEEPVSPTQKQATPSAKVQPKSKGIVYLKTTGDTDNIGGALGELWVYDLSSKKVSSLTKDGKIDVEIKLSPDGNKIAYKRDVGSVQSIWIYDFRRKMEEKIDEIEEASGSGESSSLRGLVWRDDNKFLAYLENVIDNKMGDPRQVKRNILHTFELENSKKANHNLPKPTGDGNTLLAWTSNEVFFWSIHDACGDLSMKSYNLATKATKDHTAVFNGFGACPTVTGSPDSRKISIDGFALSEQNEAGKIKILDLLNGVKTVLNIENKNPAALGTGGWVNDGSGYGYLSTESDKMKVTLNNFTSNQIKFALFNPSSSIPDSSSYGGGLQAFEDYNLLVVFRIDDKTKETSYSLLDIEKVTETKLPFRTTDWLHSFVLIEDL
jgi:dipeptidyl aminopeptidase/acylaminoacyl peptidase